MANTGNAWKLKEKVVDNTMNGEEKDVEDADTASNGTDESDYNAIESYLSSGCYPENMKSIFKKVSSKYILLKGILHLKIKMKVKSGTPACLLESSKGCRSLFMKVQGK